MTLCELCEINKICNESHHGFAEEVCQHYKNESSPIPLGYIYYGGAFRKIHKEHWNKYDCYILVDYKKKWLTNENIKLMNDLYKAFLRHED